MAITTSNSIRVKPERERCPRRPTRDFDLIRHSPPNFRDLISLTRCAAAAVRLWITAHFWARRGYAGGDLRRQDPAFAPQRRNLVLHCLPSCVRERYETSGSQGCR